MEENRSYELNFIFQATPYEIPIPENVEVVYLIQSEWWNKWCGYAGLYTEPIGPRPGKIINAGIDLNNPEPNTYVYLPKVTWRRLRNWYKFDMKKIAFVKNRLLVFSYIKVSVSGEHFESRTISVPLWYTLRKFKARVQKKLKLVNNACKFYIDDRSGGKTVLNSDDKILSELEFYDMVRVVVKAKGFLQKSVSFAGPDGYDEDRELKAALEESIKISQTEDNKLEIDTEKIENIKNIVGLEKIRIKIEVKPLKELRKNLDALLENLDSF